MCADKRVTRAAERIPLPRKVRERAALKREREKKKTLSISQRHTDVPAIVERVFDSVFYASHYDKPCTFTFLMTASKNRSMNQSLSIILPHVLNVT